MEILESQNRIINLKARQLGISWLICAYVLHQSLFYSGKSGLFFSKGQLESDELLDHVKGMYDRLPYWMRTKLPGLSRKPTNSHIEWMNGSQITSLPATASGGSGFTASFVFLDEFAKMLFADKCYTSIKPTIDNGGKNVKMVIVSTADGVGNAFHKLFTQAQSGQLKWRAVFIPYYVRPGRDDDWYQRQIDEAIDPETVKQEYPRTPTEAFLVSGSTRFASSWLDDQEENVREPIPLRYLPRELQSIPGLSVYHLPVSGYPRACVIGCDVAEGLEHGDYSDATGMFTDTFEEAFNLHGHWEPDEYARYLKILADFYDGTLVVERNNHGHALMLALKYQGCDRVADGPDDRSGWFSDGKNKPISIDELARMLRDGTVLIRTRAAIGEMKVYKRLGNGKTGAPSGMHDDRVMSWAVLLGWIAMCGQTGEASWGPAPWGRRRW